MVPAGGRSWSTLAPRDMWPWPCGRAERGQGPDTSALPRALPRAGLAPAGHGPKASPAPRPRCQGQPHGLGNGHRTPGSGQHPTAPSASAPHGGRLPSAAGRLWRSLALQFIVGNHENTANVTEPRRNYSSSDGSRHAATSAGPRGGWRPRAAPGQARSRPRGSSPPRLRAVWHRVVLTGAKRVPPEHVQAGSGPVPRAGRGTGRAGRACGALGTGQSSQRGSAAPGESGGHSPAARGMDPVVAVPGRSGHARPRRCSRASRVENEPFLKKVLKPHSSPASPRPLSPSPAASPTPASTQPLPPTITPTVTCRPPPHAAPCPACTPLPGPSLGLPLCQDLACTLCPARLGKGAGGWGEGMAELSPSPPPIPQNKRLVCSQLAAGPGLPSLCSAPCSLVCPPGPGAHWAIGGHSQCACGEHGHRSVQLGKAPDGHFTLLLVGHQLLEMQGTPSDEAEGRADGP